LRSTGSFGGRCEPASVVQAAAFEFDVFAIAICRLTGAVALPSCSHEHSTNCFGCRNQSLFLVDNVEARVRRADLGRNRPQSIDVSGSNGRLGFRRCPPCACLPDTAVLRDFKLPCSWAAAGSREAPCSGPLRHHRIGQGSRRAACSRDDASLARSAATKSPVDRKVRETPRPSAEVPSSGKLARCGLRSAACPCTANAVTASQVTMERRIASIASIRVGGSGAGVTGRRKKSSPTGWRKPR